MSLGEIASMIGGMTAFLGFAYGVRRNRENERGSAESNNATTLISGASVLLGGWQDFHAKAMEEVERVRVTCQAQIAELKAEHEADRAQWDRERARLQAEVDRLDAAFTVLVEKAARS